MTEKIQKVLARAGLTSRRQIEEWIRNGRITINQQLATIGARITSTDKIYLDGRLINLAKSQHQKTKVLLYHKLEGEICTRSDPQDRPTVFSRLPLIRNGRWISIGRLDFNTSGLLLLTNNGELANQLMHPRAQFEREYAVRVRGKLSPANLTQLTRGITLDDGLARCKSITYNGGSGSNLWYHVVVAEGRNRLIRRLFAALGFTVSRLIRIRYGNITLPTNLRRGHYYMLDPEVVAELHASST